MKLQLHIIIKGYVTDRSVYLDYIRLLLQSSECCSFCRMWAFQPPEKNTHFSLGGEWPPHCELNMQLWSSSLWGPFQMTLYYPAYRYWYQTIFSLLSAWSLSENLWNPSLQVDLLWYNLITVLQMPQITHHSCVRVPPLRSCSAE